jgi:hypothetical protein
MDQSCAAEAAAHFSPAAPADPMTAEQFRQKYHLLDRVTDGTVHTYHAQFGGTMVMVHFLHGPPEELAAIDRALEGLDEARREKLLERADVDGSVTLVTRFILDFTTLHDWLKLPRPTHHGDGGDAGPPAARPRLGVPQPPAATSSGSPGEFTLLFGGPGGAGADAATAPRVETSGDSMAGTEPPLVAPPDAGPVEAAPVDAARAEPGEFTRLFKAATPADTAPLQPEQPAAPEAPARPEPALPPTPRAGSASPEQPAARGVPEPPGEFTRMFGAAPAAAQEQPPAPADPSNAPAGPAPAAGNAPPAPPPVPPAPPAAEDASWPVQPAPVREPPRSTAPGQYTRVFGTPAQPPGGDTATRSDTAATPGPWPVDGPAPSAGAGPGSGDYLERLTGSPAATGRPMPPPMAPPPMNPVPSAHPSPGEFTRVVSAAPAPAARTGKGSPSLPPSAPRGAATERWLIFGLVAVLITALLLVLLVLLLLD